MKSFGITTPVIVNEGFLLACGIYALFPLLFGAFALVGVRRNLHRIVRFRNAFPIAAVRFFLFPGTLIKTRCIHVEPF